MSPSRLALSALFGFALGCDGQIFSALPNGSTATVDGVPTAGGAFDPAFACSAGSEVQPTTIRRLAAAHYTAAVKDFVSALKPLDAATVLGRVAPQLALLPADASAVFSRNDLSVTTAHAGAVFEVAFALGSVLANDAGYAGQLASVCGPGSTQASLTGTCRDRFVAYYGRKAFRRPLTAAEVTELLVDPASTATPPAQLDLRTADGLTALLTRLLAHPRFYYRLDNEGALLSGTDGDSGATYQLSSYELLAKLTFLWWDAPPSDALYDRARSLDVSDPAQVASLVGTLLGDGAARTGVQNFYAEWLKFRSTPQLDSMNSPAYKTFAQGENVNVAGHDHRRDMIQEIADLTSFYTFDRAGRYEDLLESPYSFARTADLAKLYGLTTVWDGTPATLAEFPAEQPRVGLLTRGAFLANGIEYTDPILKGRRIRFDLLCDVLPPPPATVNLKAVAQDATHTTRYLSEQTTAADTCQTCHRHMNPLGFSSEGYDSLGRFRTREQKFDPSTGAEVGAVPVTTAATPGLFDGDTRSLTDVRELSTYIAESGVGQRCMVRQYFRYAFGRAEDVTADGCSLESLRQGLTGVGGSLKSMFASISAQPELLQRKVQ